MFRGLRLEGQGVQGNRFKGQRLKLQRLFFVGKAIEESIVQRLGFQWRFPLQVRFVET
ncbi:hypothetical protein D3C76_1626340 [compost metagenome]